MKQPKDRALNFTQINKHPDNVRIASISHASLKNYLSSLSFSEYFTKGIKYTKEWLVVTVVLITVIYCFSSTRAKLCKQRYPFSA